MPDKLRFQDVSRALRSSWSAQTSGGWLADNPARGQCNVTALLANDLFGGNILKTPLPDGDHFYNRIDGARIDFTAEQFDTPIGYVDLPSNRAEALAGTTLEKYEALSSAFHATIKSICR
jgi:hypothetical protein